MAQGRSNHGENSKDGFDYQLHTLLYCIETLTKYGNGSLEFDVGSGLDGYGALDDVVLRVTYPDSTIQYYLLQVKHSMTGKIHEHYLCYNGKTYVTKYFNTFSDLLMRKIEPIPREQIGQLIIWTNMPRDTKVYSWFEEYPKDEPLDIWKDSGLKRYRFSENKFKEIGFLFHPRMELVYEIVDAICKKEWKTSSAKSYYVAMRQQIIEGDGPDAKFKQEFISESRLEHDETARFRQCFKLAMERKFIRDSTKPQFSMDKLNNEYKEYFDLNVDTNKVVRWEGWTNEDEDLEAFRKRFVFCVEMPNVENLEKILQCEVNYFPEVSEMLKRMAFKKMVNKKQYQALILLVKLQKSMDPNPYTKLNFDYSDDPLPEIIEKFLTDASSEKRLHIKSPQDVYCTISRLLPSVRNALAPKSDRYLVLSWEKFNMIFADNDVMLQNESLVANGLTCLIIAAVPREEIRGIEKRLQHSKVKVILVGDQLDDCFVDEFDVSKLHAVCKNEISNRKIILPKLHSTCGAQGNKDDAKSTAGMIYGNKLFEKENHQLTLELFRNEQPIKFDATKLHRAKHFRKRNIKVGQQTLTTVEVFKAFKQIVISDQAGTGKSTELINIGFETQEDYKDHLIIYLELVHGLALYDERKDIGDNICKMMNIQEGIKQTIVRKIVELKKVILLLDGLDEVSNKFETKLKKMLETISKANLFKLVIATRPHCCAFFQKISSTCGKCELEPFSEKDQLEYLLSFWETDKFSNESDRLRIKRNAQELIAKIRSMLKNDSLIGIPLQTYMIAVIYEKSIVLEDFEQPKPYKIGYIYKQFVHLKLEEFIARNFKEASTAHDNFKTTLRNTTVPNHIALAQEIYTKASESALRERAEQLQTIGLVRLHPTIAFVHNTYYEYFLSLYFLTYVTNYNEHFISFMRQNLGATRGSLITKFMDFHIDRIDPSKALEIGHHVTNRFSSDFLPPPTTRLHSDKLREFHHYLLKDCTKDQQYTLVRNSFNLSVFNVFEVLYDSLPEESKAALKFCFGKKSDPYYINLKQLGGNQMLQLLKILQKKHPKGFVQLYLTPFKDNEEDFLEVTCRKPFVQVLDWIVKELIPNLIDDDKDALCKYVGHRFDKYFQLIVQNNNAVLLERSIQHAKPLWPKSVINKFLLERNVLLTFLNAVELQCATKELDVQQRIQMVYHIHDIYQWASDEQLPASEDYRIALTSLRIDAIKRAFNDTFPNL